MDLARKCLAIILTPLLMAAAGALAAEPESTGQTDGQLPYTAWLYSGSICRAVALDEASAAEVREVGSR